MPYSRVLATNVFPYEDCTETDFYYLSFDFSEKILGFFEKVGFLAAIAIIYIINY